MRKFLGATRFCKNLDSQILSNGKAPVQPPGGGGGQTESPYLDKRGKSHLPGNKNCFRTGTSPRPARYKKALQSLRYIIKVAILHCKEHQKENNPTAQGNGMADETAKAAASKEAGRAPSLTVALTPW